MSRKTYEELVVENNNLLSENNGLKQENTKQAIEIENLKLHINALNRYIFGSKRESTPKEENVVEGTQCSFFGEVQDEEIKIKRKNLRNNNLE